jgi:diaminopimelate epimerase
MRLEFVKMSGAGNDFVLIDNRTLALTLDAAQVARLCHRQKGIGADGLILLEPCSTGKADWAWRFFNSDGSVAEMCGNGARCFAGFVRRLTGSPDPLSFETLAGVIRAEFTEDRVTVNLTEPTDLRLDRQVEVSTGTLSVHSLDTGVPHAVIFVPDADTAMVQRLGAEVRHHQLFAPRGTNVNFVQCLGPAFIRVRTYERGVEGETLACGTGVTAAALIASRVHHFSSPVKVQVQSGDVLQVSFRVAGARFTDVKLTGPAEFVFEGSLTL